MNGKEPPTLIKVKASTLVATAHVGFNSQSNHHRNGDKRSTAGHDADHAREEKHDYQSEEFGPGHAPMIARPDFLSRAETRYADIL